jgi:hypothetical protein
MSPDCGGTWGAIMSDRSFEKVYLPSRKITTDCRRYLLNGVQSATYDSLVLRMSSEPAARLPNDIGILSGAMRQPDGEIEALVNICIGCGLFELLRDADDREFISTQDLQTWYADAVRICDTNSKNARQPRKKRKRTKPIITSDEPVF